MGLAPLEGAAVIRIAFLLSTLFATTVIAAEERPQVIIVVGAEGEQEYGPQFRAWAERWRAAAERGGADAMLIGLDDSAAVREQLTAELTRTREGAAPLWLVLIGHGTFDGKTAKFNLRGEDLSAPALAAALKEVSRPTAIINCTSCSGAFLSELSAPGRVVITATKSGHEYNFARFGDYLSSAIGDATADLDKDEQTSLLEAYLVASAKTREFYRSESRLATEHALLDDNGDRAGTPAEWFQGLRPTKAAKDGAKLDGDLARTFVLVRSAREERLSAEFCTQRDEIEKRIAELRGRKSQLDEAVYFGELEKLLLEEARLYQAADKPQQ